MAYVERELRVITIRSHSDAGVRKGSCRRTARWPENVYRLGPKFIRPQETPDTFGFGVAAIGRFESKAYFGVIGQNVELALDVASRGYVLEAGVLTPEASAAELHKNPAVIAAYRGCNGADVLLFG